MFLRTIVDGTGGGKPTYNQFTRNELRALEET